MKLTIEIHDAWLARPDDLRRVMALLAGLEDPPTGTGPTDRTHDRARGAVRAGRPASGSQRTLPGGRRPQPGEP